MAMTLDKFIPKFEDVSVCPQARMLSIRNDYRQPHAQGWLNRRWDQRKKMVLRVQTVVSLAF